MEGFLGRRRREFDEKYDFRYSQLVHVFGRLLAEKRVTEEELAGLNPERLEGIRTMAAFYLRDRSR